MTVDISKPIQFTVAGGSDQQVYTWHPESNSISWIDVNKDIQVRKYSPAQVLHMLAQGSWVLVEDTGWYDRKEFPPAGTTIRINPGIVATVIGLASNGDMIAESDRKLMRVTSPLHIRPLNKTHEELRIIEVAKDLGVTEDIAEMIVAKGYTKQ